MPAPAPLETPPSEPLRRAPLWTWLAVVASSIYTFVVLVLPARGLTFLWDDWTMLSHFARTPAPRRWLAMNNDHWKPLYHLLFDIERLAFGANHTFFIVVTWAIHTLNVYLLARLLGRTHRDERVGALAALAFGLCAVWRDVIWWAELGGLALCFTVALGGFLALDAWRRGSRWGGALAVAAAFVDPCLHSYGLALGPALALEAWWLSAGKERWRLSSAIAGAWVLYVALYLVNTPARTGGELPHTLAHAVVAAKFITNGIGLGIVHETLLVPAAGGSLSGFVSDEALAGPTGLFFTAIYAAFVALAAASVEREQRRRLLVAQVYLLGLLVPAALFRWFFPARVATFSRYLYLPCLAWTTTLAAGLALALRRSPAKTLAVALPLLALLGALHAWIAGHIESAGAPPARRAQVVFVEHLVAATTQAKGPVYDVGMPYGFEALTPLTAQDVVNSLAPDVAVVWTRTRSAATVACYEADPVLRPLAH